MVNEKKKVNGWRIAFFSLLALILIGVGVVGYMGTRPVDTPRVQKSVKIEEDHQVQISMNRKQAMTIISYYLNQTVGKKNLNFEFVLNDQAEIQGKFKVMGMNMDFSVYFTPVVLENGNIKLKATRLSIGALRLPIRVILSFIANGSNLPSFITIQPEDKEILIDLNHLKLENGMQIRAQDIDLQSDRLTFNVYLPLTENEK